MKNCPFCNELIQDDAIKCRFCGEWLKTPDNIEGKLPLRVSPISSQQIAGSYQKTPLRTASALKDISLAKTIALILISPAIVILLDIFFVMMFSRLSRETSEINMLAIINIFYFSLGIWMAEYFYKIKKAMVIIVLSFFLLFLYRFIIISIFSPDSLGLAMSNTLKEGLVLYVSLFLFCVFFRHFEPKFDYAEIKDKHKSVDINTKKRIETGTCSKCGVSTVIGKQRSINFLGMSTEYFCKNCKRFIRGNPLNSIFMGITEAIVFSLLTIAYFATLEGNSTSSTSSTILVLVYIVAIYDGIKRAYYGIRGVVRSAIK